jgi:hypothetical protein
VSDRANELRRQRDLLRDNLAWIEKEIAAEEGRANAASPGVPPPLVPPASFSVDAPDAARDAEAILSEYRTAPVSISSQTKLGCISYFAVAMVLIVGAFVAYYFHIKASRGH